MTIPTEGDGWIRRTCQSCGGKYFDNDTEPCRGELKDPPWCDGRHNCPYCKINMDLLLAVVSQNNNDDFFRDQRLLDFYNSLPEDHQLRFAIDMEIKYTTSGELFDETLILSKEYIKGIKDGVIVDVCSDSSCKYNYKAHTHVDK